MRRIGSGSRAIWCSRPVRVRRTSPARSSTFTCFETALNDMSKGWARSVTRAAPFASRWTISRRVGSESAAKARSRTGVVIFNLWVEYSDWPALVKRSEVTLMRTRWELASATHVVPVSSSRPAILGATILLGAVFTFSAWCAVAAIDPTPRRGPARPRDRGRVPREPLARSAREVPRVRGGRHSGVLDRRPALADARGLQPAGWPVYSHPGTRGAYRLPRRPRLVHAAGMAVGRAADERARRIGRADPRLTTPRSRVRPARALSAPRASPP